MHHPDADLAPSFEWIRQHPLATTHDVPMHLIRAWLISPNPKEARTFEYYLQVFLYGTMQRQLLHSPPGMKRTLPLAEIEANFPKWQTKLTMAEMERRAELRFSPLPLFDFNSEEEIQFWREQDEKGV